MINTFLASLALLAEQKEAPTFTLFGGLLLIILVFWFFASDKDRVRKKVGLVVMIAVVVFSLLAIADFGGWVKVIKGEKKFSEVSHVKRGIDIAGGVSFVLEVVPSETGGEVTVGSMAEVERVIKKRLASIGYTDPVVKTSAESKRIEVQIPDVNSEQAKPVRNKLTEVAVLNIFEVDRNSRAKVAKFTDEATGEVDLEALKDDLLDERVFPYTQTDDDGVTTTTYVVTKRNPEIEGKDVQEASADPQSGTILRVRLTGEGGEKNEAFTGRLEAGRDQIAIVFDGQVLSLATQQADELDRDFVITGLDNITETRRIASNMVNPLTNKPEIKSERNVSATLGEQTIKQGIQAGLAGLGLTLLFVVFYYRAAGLIAIVGLVINILVIFSCMALMKAAVTLPGIAGIILTIGVAVDANVLIYERLREERESGKSFVEALRIAYEKAFSAIIDANITTLITAVILFAMATGSIQGFAVTLTIGIMGTLLAALVCTRVLFWFAGDFGLVKENNFMNLIPKKSFDFIRKGKITLGFSGAVVALCLGVIVLKGDDTLGVEFTGGSNIEYSVAPAAFEGADALTQAGIQAKLDTLELTQKATAQIAAPATISDSAAINKTITINCSTLDEEVAMVDEALRTMHPALQKKVEVMEKGEPVMRYAIQANPSKISASMGHEFLTNSLIALGLGLVGILIYITLRFEFSFAVGAFFALGHDIIIVLGLLILKGDEITLIHVGAFLTIAGYSINDTIVVFDRIRENLRYSEDSIVTVMNTAISATLSRTILTSVTTFVAVLVLYLFGGTALSGFAFTIMLGVIVGTYSSIFVAAPIVNLFSKKRGTDLREEIKKADEAGEELVDDEEVVELEPA